MRLIATLRRMWETHPRHTSEEHIIETLNTYITRCQHGQMRPAAYQLRREYYNDKNAAGLFFSDITAVATLENRYRHGSTDPDTDFQPTGIITITTGFICINRYTIYSPGLSRRIYALTRRLEKEAQ